MSRMYHHEDALPTGTLLLEASAGTGKTHAIAHLASRYVAECTPRHPDGVDISRLLLITFSNAAALELRQRVFSRLTQDLAEAAPPERERLERALAQFDQASISTIHSFCEQTLRGLGVLGDWDEADVISPGVAEVIDQCVSDVYISRYLVRSRNRPTVKLAGRVGPAAARSSLPLKPDEGEPREFADAVRRAFRDRRERESWTTFDDLQTRLRDLLASDVGTQVRQQLQQRYDVVLVDEFQDTDPDQWAIIEDAFVTDDRPTIMIGDPKQSIYGFRNADLVSYGKAAARSEIRTLGTNYRSDPGVVRAVSELFDTVTMGAPTVRVEPVDVHHVPRFSVDDAHPAGLWLRTGEFEQEDPTTTIDADVRSHILHLLERGRITDDDQTERPVRPGDIVILTRSGYRALDLEHKLTAAGIPAVWSGTESVLRTNEASQWASVINAMGKLDKTSVVLAGLTPLMGFRLDQLMDPGSGALAEASRVIHTAARQLRDRSSHSWTRTILEQRRTAERLGTSAQGERSAIALEQVADVLMSIHTPDPVALQEDFARLLELAAESSDPAQRVPTGPDAVAIQTLHSAKGLQFPIVLLPEVSKAYAKAWEPFPYIDEDNRRHLWVGTTPGRSSALRRRFEEQSREEELRLLYVGITRAKHLCIAWHAMDSNAEQGALTALLARRKGSIGLERTYQSIPSLRGRFDPCLIDVGPMGALPAGTAPAHEPAAEVRASTFDRVIDHSWRRTSYSGLTAALHEVAPGMDETEALHLDPAASASQTDVLSPMDALPGGAGFGTAVHQMMEELDWASGSLRRDARQLARTHGAAVGLERDQMDALGSALVAIATTPLGRLADGLSLREIPIAARLSELDFDLPMAERGPARTVAHLAAAMTEHLAADDPLHAYPELLAHSAAGESLLAGVLTGSIDAVLQLPSEGFIIVDYKTNRFPTTQDQPLTAGHYHPAAMAEAMMQSHYPLQALLYGAALHRYLAWRMPDYRPDRHLAGVGYLFVRGMAGPETPVLGSMPCGVFTWRPPAALFITASEILGGGT